MAQKKSLNSLDRCFDSIPIRDWKRIIPCEYEYESRQQRQRQEGEPYERRYNQVRSRRDDREVMEIICDEGRCAEGRREWKALKRLSIIRCVLKHPASER